MSLYDLAFQVGKSEELSLGAQDSLDYALCEILNLDVKFEDKKKSLLSQENYLVFQDMLKKIQIYGLDKILREENDSFRRRKCKKFPFNDKTLYLVQKLREFDDSMGDGFYEDSFYSSTY